MLCENFNSVMSFTQCFDYDILSCTLIHKDRFLMNEFYCQKPFLPSLLYCLKIMGK